MPSKADVLSSVRFNHDGSLLATGDKGGRVVVFKKSHQVSRSHYSGYVSGPAASETVPQKAFLNEKLKDPFKNALIRSDT